MSVKLKATEKILILILISLLFLIFLANNIQPKKILNPNTLTINNLEEKVIIEGKTDSIKSYPEVTYINIQNSNLSIVVFTKNQLEIKKDDKIKIEGKISQNKAELQIIADKITILS